MFSLEKERRYFNWVEIWSSEDKAKAVELEMAFYTSKIKAKIVQRGDRWVLEVPWIFEELGKTVLEAFQAGLFDYPHEIEMGEKWQSYNRYPVHKFRGRGSKVFLVLGFVVFLLVAVKMLYSTGILH